MSDAPSACETCGRHTTGRDRCPKHPGARLLDLRDPEDAAWAESVKALQKDRRGRILGLVGAVSVTALLGMVLMAGVAETNAMAAYTRDASVEAVIVLGAFLVAVALVVGRVGRDAFRALTGRDTTPDAYALRKARGIRAALTTVGSLLAWGGVQGLLELLGGHVGALTLGVAALLPLGLAMIAGTLRVPIPRTEDVPTPLPTVDDADEERADLARSRERREGVRARHKPPVHTKVHGG
jgi:hypothetical protein